uniref:Uncharacterized protein n=1 Tax=Oryza meridionalis TaxID=40149 RepID=A0A0E0E8J4_9ORYZ
MHVCMAAREEDREGELKREMMQYNKAICCKVEAWKQQAAADGVEEGKRRKLENKKETNNNRKGRDLFSAILVLQFFFFSSGLHTDEAVNSCSED